MYKYDSLEGKIIVLHDKGFSLVELSVVLIIIALIVSGFLAGKSLIRTAEVRAVVTEGSQLRAAVNAFVLTYNALPGDFAEAYDYWGSDCTTGPAAEMNCNGNGDGRVNLTGASDNNEPYRAWQHMGLAGLVEGYYNGIGFGAGNTAISGVNIPAASIRYGGYCFIYGNLGAEPFRNMLLVGLQRSTGPNNGAIFKPEEAYLLDKKMDDGLPEKGVVISIKGEDVTDECVVAGEYNIQNNSVLCQMGMPGEG